MDKPMAAETNDQDAVALSIVAPMHDEAGVAAEFVRRCAAAAAGLGVSWELIVCDDASADDTVVRLHAAAAEAEVAATAGAAGGVRVLQQARNLGQIGATLAAMAASRGAWVVVLDGDLQDPPEVIPDLWRRGTQAASRPSAVFAVKTTRDDPRWFLVGRSAFAGAQALMGGALPPPGAGAFCLLPGEFARRVARADVIHANLAPLVMAVLARDDSAGGVATVGYAKAARYDGMSRVGPIGLAREAMGSLELSGALGRGFKVAAVAGAVGAVGLLPTLLMPPVGLPLLAGAGWLVRSVWRAGQRADARASRALEPTETAPERGHAVRSRTT